MKQFLILFMMLLLSGCTFVPKRTVPTFSLPESYSRPLHNCTVNNKSLHEWWTIFNAPVLTNLIEQALAGNYDLRMSLEKIDEARNNYRIERSKVYPNISGLGGIFKSSFGETIFSPLPLNNVTSSIFALDTIWEIDLWGRLRGNKNAAHYRYEAEIEDMRDVRIVLLAQVATTYLHLCALNEKITVLQTYIETDKKLILLAKDAFISGIDNKPNVLTQAISYDQAATQLIDARADQQKTSHTLAFLLGNMPHQLRLQQYDAHNLPSINQLIDIEAPYMLLRRRPDIRRAERQLAASYEDIGVAMADWLPKFSLLAVAGKTDLSSCLARDTDSKLLSIGPFFTIPIIDFGKIYSNVQVQKSKERQAMLMYEKTVTNAAKEVEDALVLYAQEQIKYATLYEKCEHERERLRFLQDTFKSGLDAEQALLNQQKQFYTVELDLIDSHEKCLKNLVTLYKALGGGW